MKTCVIYARYSSDSQSEQSIEGQLRVCNDYAKANDILILDTYIDRAMTGTNDNRPAFQKMIKDSSKREWDYILLYKLDRFSRDKYATAIYKKKLKDNGVKVLSAMENIPDTPEGIILESLLEGMNQYYSAELSQKVKRGLKETRLKGNFTGGIIIYGYSIKDKKVVINEEQAEVIKYIFSEYAKGKIVREIIVALNEQKIYNKGKPFARTSVYNILRNEKYSGVYRYGNEVFDNIYPRIVPQEIYDTVRAKIEKNRYGKQSIEDRNLLRLKLKCGYCGEKINSESGTAKSGQKKRYYKCMGRKTKNGCTKETVRKDILENLVVEEILSVLNNEKNINFIVKGLLKLQDKKFQANDTLNRLLKQLQQTEIAISNIMNAIEQGGSTNTAMKRIRELEDKKEMLDRTIILEKSKTTRKLTEKEIREYFKQAITNDIQSFVNMMIKEITLYDDKMDIQFNTPLQTSPDESQGFIFYVKQSKMPVLVDNNKKYKMKDFKVIMRV